jgi:hypothetical protein
MLDAGEATLDIARLVLDANVVPLEAKSLGLPGAANDGAKAPR